MSDRVCFHRAGRLKMIFDSNDATLGLSLYARGVAFLFILIPSILAASSRIIRCASADKIPTATIWIGVLILSVGGLVFVAGLLRLLPMPALL